MSNQGINLISHWTLVAHTSSAPKDSSQVWVSLWFSLIASFADYCDTTAINGSFKGELPLLLITNLKSSTSFP